MRNHLLVALFVVVSGFIAEDARACKQCYSPSPSASYQCASTICGVTVCIAGTYSWGTWCAYSGECAENAAYCGSSEREPQQLWACAAPPSRNWKLVAVKIKRNAGKAA
jgi:hypothetical protein